MTTVTFLIKIKKEGILTFTLAESLVRLRGVLAAEAGGAGGVVSGSSGERAR